MHDGHGSIWNRGGNTPLILEKMTYQEKTGTFSPGAHAGSYNGQDAYNDMLVTEDELCISGDRNLQGIGTGIGSEAERLQGCDRPDCERGGQRK